MKHIAATRPTWCCPACGKKFWYGIASRIAEENPCRGSVVRGRYQEHTPTALERITEEDA